jgi:hypothetical protein
MGIHQLDKKLLKRIFNQISGKVEKEEELIPEIAIKGSGHIWCLDPSQNRIIRITRGIKCYILNETKDELNRFLVYTINNDVILIEEEELIYTGYD